MPKYVIKSITKDGLNIDPLPRQFRLTTPKVGDLIEVKEGVVGMIERKWNDMGGFHVCVGGRSVFMGKDHISISGGPFRVIPFDKVKPTYRMEEARFWTWAHYPEGDGGVEFKIARPVFKEVE